MAAPAPAPGHPGLAADSGVTARAGSGVAAAPGQAAASGVTAGA